MCVFAALQARAQESLDIELERYERMCAMCLDLRTRMDRGEQLSRDEAKATLDIFVASNKKLKTRESGMTALHYSRNLRRFVSSRWNSRAFFRCSL